MCGRYSLDASASELAARFGVPLANLQWDRRYNLAPSQQLPVVMGSDDPHIDLLEWGFASHTSRAYINARVETVATSSLFGAAVRARRCIVPATGFYEWANVGGSKQPYHIVPPADGIFSFAGIWEPATPRGNGRATFAVLTMAPTRQMSAQSITACR